MLGSFPKPYVFDRAIKWRTEGEEQMLLLLELTMIQGLRPASICPAKKQEVSRHRIDDRQSSHCLVSESTECLQFDDLVLWRRTLTRYDPWSVTVA